MVHSISLAGAGKKYYREWIFRNASLTFSSGDKVVFLGPNGSGKSTLLQLIAGAVLPNEGSIRYQNEESEIPAEDVYNHVSFASPYLELIEEFTLGEIVRFHFKFRRPKNGLSTAEIMELTGLKSKEDRHFRYFSSGMKQRVKLALAFLADTSVLILDEPCSNLDASGIDWFRQMIAAYTNGRIVIIASNQNKIEYDFCDREYTMSDFKK